MLSDIQIAQKAKVLSIGKIAKKLAIPNKYLEQHGSDKAKIKLELFNKLPKRDSKLVLVTAITPTPLGEGKSTTTIGLTDALGKLDKNVVACLREPSLGPVFGVKGGACGGGFAQVNPMADINLHFTGDIHAITTANNLISACIDNSLYFANKLNIDPNRIIWKRCMDLNDRALREVIVSNDTKKENVKRKDYFNISVASEIMAILCLSKDLEDLRCRIDRSIVAYTFDNKPVTVKDLGITGSIVVLLKDAIKPNLVQTLENNPVLMHGGPFANIAHGCNSVIATSMGLRLADYVITEAGFGADLGAEKFLDIKCRELGIKPNAVVLVATIKALKYHGGAAISECTIPNVDYLKKGVSNLEHHINILKEFNLPFVVALNRFNTDSEEEINWLLYYCKKNNYPIALSEVFAKGSLGGIELAKEVLNVLNQDAEFKYIYDLNDPIETKIEKICQKVYQAKNVVFTENAQLQLEKLDKEEVKDYYICMAKTPLSITDDPKVVCDVADFSISIKEIRISAGPKFIICLTGDIMTMPGLPKVPLANKIDIVKGKIVNLS